MFCGNQNHTTNVADIKLGIFL